MSGSTEMYYGTKAKDTNAITSTVNVPHEEGNRKTRRKKAKAQRKAKKQAIKLLRGGIGNDVY